MGGDRDEGFLRMLLKGAHGREQRRNAVAGVDQQIAVASLDQPDVGAQELVDEGLGEQRHAGAGGRRGEPFVDDRESRLRSPVASPPPIVPGPPIIIPMPGAAAGAL